MTLPITTRANFWAIKFISLVLFEQLKMPKAWSPWLARLSRKPVAMRAMASSQVARRN